MLIFIARRLLHLVLAILCAGGAWHASAAQSTDYPSKPIKLIVPFAPGGVADVLGRMIGKKLDDELGQTVVVENRSGAGGTIGLEQGLRSSADGYVLVMAGSADVAVAPALYEKLPYDSITDLTPICNVANVPYALAVNPHLPVKTLKDLIAIAGKKKDSFTYGSSGIGSSSDLAAEMLKSMSHINLVGVPYRGTAPALTAVISDRIDMMFAAFATIRPYAESGKLRMLAVTSGKRLAQVPNVPTVAESGLLGYELTPWFGVVGPKDMPKEVVTKLNSAIVRTIKSKDVLRRFDQLGYQAIGDTPEHFAATIKADVVRYAQVVETAGIKRRSY